MKLIGIILIALSAVVAYTVYRQSTIYTLRLLNELADDLLLLECRICVQRCPLTVILEDDLRFGLSGKYLWSPLAARLTQAADSFYVCWEASIIDLPPMLTQRLLPLGKLLPLGGDLLADTIQAIHGDFLRLAHEQQAQQTVNLRLTASVCFSAAALFILICI